LILNSKKPKIKKKIKRKLLLRFKKDGEISLRIVKKASKPHTILPEWSKLFMLKRAAPVASLN
jgi:hypothetical protein